MKVVSKNVFAAQVKDGEKIKDIFLVKRKGKGTSRSGNSYLMLALSDRSGDIEGRIWERADQFDKIFDSGDAILVEGRASQYQGKPQISINDVSKIPQSEVPIDLLLPSSAMDPAELMAEIKRLFSKVANPYLKKLVNAFFKDEGFVEDFKRAPAATGVHHSYLGGLAEHVLSLLKLSLMICDHYPALNSDVLMAGVLFHDMGKIKEMRFKSNFEYTDEGKLLGHIMIGCDMMDEKIKSIRDFPEDLRMVLKHMIISHHGELEYGSPKLPQTLEAVVLHYIDNLDAKINTISGMIDAAGDENWSEYNRFMGRGFYKSPIEATHHPEAKEIMPSTKRRKSKRKKANKEAGGELDLFK